MPSLRDIRRRIGSVKSTQQITKAMKMVAAAKLRRAQEAITRARPYATLLEQALTRVASRAGAEESAAHPLLASRPVKRVELVVITSDRGLAGGFNSNVVRRAQRFLTENADQYEEITVSTIGKKGRDSLQARKVALRKDYTGVHARLCLREGPRDRRRALGALPLRRGRRRLPALQRVQERHRPGGAAEAVPARGDRPGRGRPRSVDFLYEPSRDELLADIVPRHLDVQVFRALLDSAASEHGARMTAMEAATKNADEMIGALSLQYNRARQAYITKELMEIVSGAESLK